MGMSKIKYDSTLLNTKVFGKSINDISKKAEYNQIEEGKSRNIFFLNKNYASTSSHSTHVMKEGAWRHLPAQ